MQYLLVLPTSLTVLALCYMGFVVIRNDRSLPNRLFLLFVIVDALWLLSVWAVNATTWGFDTLLSRFVFALSIALLISLYAFMNVLLNIKHTLLYKIIIFGIGGIVLLTTLTTDLIVKGVHINVDAYYHPSPFPEYGLLSSVFFVYILITVTTLFLMMIYHALELKTSKPDNDSARRQLKTVALGFIGFVLISLLTNLILPTLVSHAWPSQFAPIGSLVLTFAFFYAIMRYKLFDIKATVMRSTAYLFLIVILAVVFVVSVNIGGSLVTMFDGQESVQKIFNVVIALAIAVSFHPLKKLFDRITNRFFFRDIYDPQAFINHLNQVLVANTELESLLTKAARIINNNLKAEYCFFVISPTKSDSRHAIGTIKKTFPYEDIEKITYLTRPHENNVFIKEYLPEDNALKEVLTKNEIAALVCIAPPSQTHQLGLGYLLLGQKKSGNSYSNQDIQVLEIFSQALLIAIQNALRFDEIQDFNRTLQQRIKDATKELRETNTQLQRLDAAKDEFVSMASHQLRTPLTSVKGYISMVLEGDVGEITTAQRQLLEEAFASSERMVHLIGDFLNVSRLQTGKFVIDTLPLDLTKVVTQEVESLQTTAHAHNLKLRFREPAYFPILYIDEGKIRQVLMNFIDNAIYYSREHTTIMIELTIEDGDAVLRVRDTGIGVPKLEQAHLFTKFFRATNARKQRPDGTGVGLFLSKKVITAHKGSMVFESIEDEGSTFGFRLPIKKLSTAPAHHADQLNK